MVFADAKNARVSANGLRPGLYLSSTQVLMLANRFPISAGISTRLSRNRYRSHSKLWAFEPRNDSKTSFWFRFGVFWSNNAFKMHSTAKPAK
jgi:hypothetical protein